MEKQGTQTGTTTFQQNQPTKSSAQLSVSLNSAQKTRRLWFKGLMNRYQAAAGVEIPTTRLVIIATLLDQENFSSHQMSVSEQWIMKGRPCKYGKITLADFFPTSDDLAEIQYDISGMMKSAERKGYKNGYSEGQSDARRDFDSNMDYLKLRKEVQESVSMDAEKSRLDGLAAIIEEEKAKLDQREKDIAGKKKLLTKYILR